uniref:Uncharacterized protein n=1 Tax=Candidatus Caldatribacterium californiense TaxID=1454726 RepID=A0A7V3YM58_9BACT
MKRTLCKYSYPPGEEEEAVQTVLKERNLTEEWVGKPQRDQGLQPEARVRVHDAQRGLRLFMV